MKKDSPFILTEPACISFSGGRTSAYMLWRFIDANGGLPDDCVVTFANTGKEAEETLEFVRDCGKYWDVPIVWIEYRWAKETKDRWKVVDFETAARNGEPFEELIHAKKYLPNPVTRFCTIELKIRPMANYLFSIGLCEKRSHGENMAIVGIRADEQRRAAKIPPHRRPLVAAGVTKKTVSQFWAEQPFDLGLPNINGVTPHGNCDLCFLKGASLVESLIEEDPSRADWWARMEREVGASKKSGGVWRKDRPTYAQMQIIARDQGQLNLAGDESIPCFCGD
jgi:3'-phosphoadenosine 5'-phosphosulfate sulfotransferase (PAPS reductase)/FAD synthetase